MEFLFELSEKDVGLNPINCKKYELRKATRAVLFNEKGQVALLHVFSKNYHKLPGGKLEGEEDVLTGLKREVLEETGFNCKVECELGFGIWYRNKEGVLQLNYCYIARTIGRAQKQKLDDAETEEGHELQWYSLDDAIKVLSKDKTDDYRGKFILKRDLLLLKKAKEIMGN